MLFRQFWDVGVVIPQVTRTETFEVGWIDACNCGYRPPWNWSSWACHHRVPITLGELGLCTTTKMGRRKPKEELVHIHHVTTGSCSSSGAASCERSWPVLIWIPNLLSMNLSLNPSCTVCSICQCYSAESCCIPAWFLSCVWFRV